MNFRAAVPTFLDRQFFPLASGVKQAQNVVEDHMQAQFWCRAAAPGNQMGQDKLRKLREVQMCRNPLPVLALRHINRQNGWILAQFMTSAANIDGLRVPDKFSD
jgi:hypothetical protein